MAFYAIIIYVYSPSGPEAELTFHDGTVRDIVFMQDISNRSSLLVSAGAGDSKIYVTDCETAMPIKAMAGHSGKDETQCEEIHPSGNLLEKRRLWRDCADAQVHLSLYCGAINTKILCICPYMHC